MTTSVIPIAPIEPREIIPPQQAYPRLAMPRRLNRANQLEFANRLLFDDKGCLGKIVDVIDGYLVLDDGTFVSEPTLKSGACFVRMSLYEEFSSLRQQGAIAGEESERAYIAARFEGIRPVDAIHAAVNYRRPS
jgi:hypothetical protein